jgi:uncharacterized membrane protein YcaP (DUF421 family)
VVVHHGRLVQRVLRRERLSVEDVMTAVREQGLPGLDEVRLAVLEVDGTISVVSEGRAEKK